VMTYQCPDPPSRCYLLCATPRTGSTFLCETLRATGKLGRPEEYFECLKDTGLPRQPSQYFNGLAGGTGGYDRIMELLGRPTLSIDLQAIMQRRQRGYRHYLDDVLRTGKTDNGVFGAKIMWGHLADFLDMLTGDPDLSCSERLDHCLRTNFPSLKYIHVTRQDKVRQAISLWKAIQTQQWRSDIGGRVTGQSCVPVFDFAAIDHLRSQLAAQDLAWQSFFRTNGIEPLVLRYAEFSLDPANALAKTAGLLGFSDELGTRTETLTMIKQSDGQSEEWAARYISIAARYQERRDEWARRVTRCAVSGRLLLSEFNQIS